MSGSSTEPVTFIGVLTRVFESLWMSEAAITFGGATNTIKTDDQMAAVIVAALPDEWNPERLQEARTSADARADAAEREVKRLRKAINFWAIPTIAVFASENGGAKNALDKLRSILQASAVKPRDSEP